MSVKRVLACALSACFLCCLSFAGDVASFADIGFSEDGRVYIFGQYGKTDVTFKPWAEIFAVDVAANQYVKGEVFKYNEENCDVSGKAAFDSLKAKSEWKLSKYNAIPAGSETLLYLRTEEGKGAQDEIVFKNFEAEGGSSSYHVKLVPTFRGTGKACQSKFYIDVSKQDENGSVIKAFKAGTPDFERKGVTGYLIEKIFTDKSGKSLVFLVKKTVEDDTGKSIRYMVETYRL